DTQELYDFGRKLGIAFQLEDDYLGLYGNPDKFGKQIGGDILANKKTYLLVTAFELAGDRELSMLREWIRPGTFDPEEKVNAVREIVDGLGIPEKITEDTARLTGQAFTHLERVAVEPERKEVLRDFAEWLLLREKQGQKNRVPNAVGNAVYFIFRTIEPASAADIRSRWRIIFRLLIRPAAFAARRVFLQRPGMPAWARCADRGCEAGFLLRPESFSDLPVWVWPVFRTNRCLLARILRRSSGQRLRSFSDHHPWQLFCLL